MPNRAERLVPLATVEVFATPIHPSLTYGSGNNNSISGIAEDRSAGGGKSDPNSHYGPDGSYNLYTKNETDAALKFMVEAAATLVGGPALKALGKAVIGVGSKLLPAAVNMLRKTSVAVNATATRGAVYLGSGTVKATVANVAGGAVEGGIKYCYGASPDPIYMFDNPAWQVGSDATNNTLNFIFDSK